MKVLNKNVLNFVFKSGKSSKSLLMTNSNLPKLRFLNYKVNFSSQSDLSKLETLRSKHVGDSYFFYSKQNIRRSATKNLSESTEKLMKIENRQEIIEKVVPELTQILITLKKQTSYKNPDIIILCLKIFNMLNEKDFPLILLPYFLNYLKTIGNPTNLISRLNENFVNDCEAALFEKAVILNITELALISILPTYFKVSQNFIPYLENTILHKLENIEKSLDFTYALTIINKNFLINCSAKFFEKFLNKFAELINQNLIDSETLSSLFFNLKILMDKNPQAILAIESFLFKIRDYLYEMPKDNIKTNNYILKLISNRQLKNLLYKNNEYLTSVIVINNLQKINQLGPYASFFLLRNSSYVLDQLDSNTIAKLARLALINIPKIESSGHLSQIVSFYHKLNLERKDKIYNILKLKLLDIIMGNDLNKRNISFCVAILKPDGVLFNTAYNHYTQGEAEKKFVNVGKKEKDQETSDSDTE